MAGDAVASGPTPTATCRTSSGAPTTVRPSRTPTGCPPPWPGRPRPGSPAWSAWAPGPPRPPGRRPGPLAPPPGRPGRRRGVELWATVGLHPHDAADGVDGLSALLDAEVGPGAASGDRVVVAIGECGLDYHYDHSPRDVQREAFAPQIALAHRHDLALVIHTREAWDDTFDLLAAQGCPTRTSSTASPAAPARPGAVSISGARPPSAAGHLQERRGRPPGRRPCPLDRLLVETDAPFLAPVPHRGTPNEPGWVPLVGRRWPRSRAWTPRSWPRRRPATPGGPSGSDRRGGWARAVRSGSGRSARGDDGDELGERSLEPDGWGSPDTDSVESLAFCGA